MERLKHYLTTTTLLTALSGLPVCGGFAQTSEEDDTFVQETIYVTARRVEEGIQDAPLSVQAYSEQGIIDAGISETADFIQLTSNVTLAESQSIGTAFLTIRGLTQVRNGESPVAVVVDGVLQFNNRQFVGQLFDIQQIEVVKGPQGALYGRNATGGAIIINTKKPSNEREGYVGFGVGNGSEISAEGSFSVPISENELFFKASGRVVSREGYYENVTRNDKDDPYFDRAFRGRLLWTLSSTQSVDIVASVTRHNGRGIGFQYDDTATADDTSLPFLANNEDLGERQTDGFSVRFTNEMEWGTFISVSSYDALSTMTRADQFPYTACANGLDAVTNLPNRISGCSFDGTQSQYTDMKAISQEFRFSSRTDQELRWELGAYYLSWERYISSTTGTDYGRGIKRVYRTPFPASSTNPTASFLGDDNSNTAYALFGQVSYDLSDDMELNFAGRFDNEDREQTVSPHNTSGEPNKVNSASFDKFSPKLTFKYKPNEDVNLYAAWGQGFRSGQFNQNGVAETASNVVDAMGNPAPILGVKDLVDQEDSTSLELGVKSLLDDGKLILNGALFDTKVEGSQYFVFIGGVGTQVLINIDEVKITGFEAEAIWKPHESVDLYASYGKTDAKVEAYTTNPKLKGNVAPYIPEETRNLGIQWKTKMNADLNFLARLDYEHRGKQYWTPENTHPRSALDLMNARLAFIDANGGWELAVEANNLTDESYNSEYVAGGFLHKANPRAVRMELRYNF